MTTVATLAKRIRRNRYQQSTEFTPVYDPDEEKAKIAEDLQSDLDKLERYPVAMNVGTREQIQAYQDWMEYQGTGLSAEQQAELQQIRDGARAQWEASEASEESQAALRQQEDARTAAGDGLNASRERADTAMRTEVQSRALTGERRERDQNPG
jgi:hypothetical protein